MVLALLVTWAIGFSVQAQLDDRATANLVALYTFQEGSGNIVQDVSGVGTPLNLTIGTPNNTTWLAGGAPGLLSLINTS